MISNRTLKIEEYCFESINKIKKEKLIKGEEILDLGIGDPDLPVHENIINKLINALKFQGFNKYPPYEGIKELKKEIIKYYNEVFNVNLQMDEVLVLIGSKEGIGHLLPVVCDYGDELIITEPKYPPYERCSKLWNIKCNKIRLLEKNNYLLNLNSISKEVKDKSKLMILNYPNNPTGAVANEYFYKEVIKYCKKNNILLCNDGAYNEIVDINTIPQSILSYDNSKTCIEIGTFSKTFNMTGFRIGYIVGNRKIINGLLKVKSSFDSGQFVPIQYAAIEALKLPKSYIEKNRLIYYNRKVAVKEILSKKGIHYFNSKGTFYIWCSTPEGYTDKQICEEFINENGIIVTPGSAFGEKYNHFFRIALACKKELIVGAMERIQEYK
ncbi:aminotransferase class I/II-fold pyridoxal phosphate-dependent enzyme [Clostridium sediminicola]|uniref:aminotransferase class I/II-fold pyridoxal phosphate-dependent enzyme n=1 Tax=Clostridium sediminicola TaxID=3114879 RepID=UPI0031F25091